MAHGRNYLDWFSLEVPPEVSPAARPQGKSLLLVRSTPGARTAWHAHPKGQVLYVTEGVGLAQSQGGPGSSPGTWRSSPRERSTGTGRCPTASSPTWPSRGGKTAHWGERVPEEAYREALGATPIF